MPRGHAYIPFLLHCVRTAGKKYKIYFWKTPCWEKSTLQCWVNSTINTILTPTCMRQAPMPISYKHPKMDIWLVASSMSFSCTNNHNIWLTNHKTNITKWTCNINNKLPKSYGKKPNPSLPDIDPEPSILFVAHCKWSMITLTNVTYAVWTCRYCKPSVNNTRARCSQSSRSMVAVPLEFTAGWIYFQTNRSTLHACSRKMPQVCCKCRHRCNCNSSRPLLWKIIQASAASSVDWGIWGLRP